MQRSAAGLVAKKRCFFVLLKESARLDNPNASKLNTLVRGDMPGAHSFRFWGTAITACCALSVVDLSAYQCASHFSGSTKTGVGITSLRVSLRLEDESAFAGPAKVRLKGTDGDDLAGKPQSDGDFLFTDITPRDYTLEAIAPGFLPVQQMISIKDHGSLTRYLVMSPKPVRAPEAPSPTISTEAALDPKTSWRPPAIDANVPYVDPEEPCPMQEITAGTGKRMTEFVANLEKFSAAERVEHYPIDILGERHDPEIRNFNYVVSVSRTSKDVFLLDEYRNGTVDPSQFPARVATVGMPAMALLFHPLLAPDFTFSCEGLGIWGSHSAWQIHFEQREGKPGRLLGYAAGGRYVSLALKGRAWIDPATLQVVHLESELIRPPVDLGLKVEDIAISYRPVHFRSADGQIWLPEVIDLFVERKGRRYYRRHTLSDFQLFTVEATQNIKFAKESYRFTNQTDRDIKGILSIQPISGAKAHPVEISFTIPAGGSVLKLVGPGKDIGIPVESIGSATFRYEGARDAVLVDAHLSKESTLDVISGSTP